MSFLSDYKAIPPTDVADQFGLVFKWLATDWRGMFEELRTNEPIFATPPFTLVTRWADVVAVLSQHQLFSVRGYAEKMDPSVGPFMLGRDETPINWHEKSVMRSLLRMSDLDSVRTMVASVTAESLAGNGPVELVSRVGRLVPLRIVQRYFGFPGPDDAKMLEWSRATQWDMFRNPTNDIRVHAANIQAGAEMRAYLRTFLAGKMNAVAKTATIAQAYAAAKAPEGRATEAKARPDDPCAQEDVVSRLIRLAQSGQAAMDTERLLSNVSGLLVGAIETTSQAIVQAIEQILKPRNDANVADVAIQAARVGGDDFDAIVWEALRFNPIAPLVVRYCERDTNIAGVAVAKGTRVAACTASAMFDPARFPNPNAFDPTRPFDSYMHFGFGHHECLGKYVGIKAIPEAVRQVLLLPGIQLIQGSGIDFKGGPFPESFVVGRS